MPWYAGKPLLELLETIEIAHHHLEASSGPEDLRFPVQYVNRPSHDFRGFCGTLAAGVMRRGDPIMALPSRKQSRIKSIVTYDGELQEAIPTQAVTVTLEDEIDVSRGDMLVSPSNAPHVGNRFRAQIVWMAEAALVPGKVYSLKLTGKTVPGFVARIDYRIDVNTLEQHPAAHLALNEIGQCDVKVGAPLVYDPYADCKSTGSFILIDRLTNMTVGAGMIAFASAMSMRPAASNRVAPSEWAARYGQHPVTLWIEGDNQRELAYHVERLLFDVGNAAVVVDVARMGLEAQSLGAEQAAAQALTVATASNDAGLICIAVSTKPAWAQGSRHLVIDSMTTSADDVIDLLHEKRVLSGDPR
jgi:bifunctional enzyme CysN/CysC